MKPPVSTRLLILLALSAIVPAAGRAASAPPQPPPAISSAVAAKLNVLRPLIEARDHAGILALVEPLLADPSLPPYDRTILSQLHAQILLSQGKLSSAVAPLETALRLADAHPAFLDTTATLELIHLLCQLRYQQALDAADPAVRQSAAAAARDLLRRWLAETPERTETGQVFASSLLYSLATLDPDRVDPDGLAAADAEARAGLLLRTRPDEALHRVLLAAAQQQEDLVAMSDRLELLVWRHPDNESYWRQLLAAYLARAAHDGLPEPEVARLQLRAILAIERAQARGFLQDPQDRFNLVGLHFNLRHYREAAALLETGLSSGRLADERRHWELLATARQQLGQPEKAVETLTRAAARFPADGQLDFALAQLHYAADRREDALRCLRAAVAKGGLDNPAHAHLWLAHLAYELGHYDEAAAQADRARESSAGAPSDELLRLTRAIAEARQKAASTATAPSS